MPPVLRDLCSLPLQKQTLGFDMSEQHPRRRSMTDGNLITHWIDGKPVTGISTRTAPVYNPAHGRGDRNGGPGRARRRGDRGSGGEAAFADWSQRSLSARTKVLFRFRELLAAEADAIAGVITDEHGKVARPTPAARCSAASRSSSSPAGSRSCSRASTPTRSPTGVDAFSFRQPLGVVAGITPFNFPAMVPLWMLPIAIACGNTFVLKPQRAGPVGRAAAGRAVAERGSARRRVQRRAGRQGGRRRDARPPGRRRGLLRRLDAGRPLHPRAGRASGKRVQALGGAKNHAVVLPDADLEQRRRAT